MRHYEKEDIIIQGWTADSYASHYYYLYVNRKTSPEEIWVDVEGYQAKITDSLDMLNEMTFKQLNQRIYGVWMLGATL